ncbi:MAG: DNA polymerase I, partial [Desulfobacteraceae bacterium]
SGFSVVVVTGDKDFRQIVSRSVSLLDTMRDRLTDYHALRNMYKGLEPRQVADVMGLAGDSADNIKGVPGIGEKKALDLVLCFGDLEALYEHLEEMPGGKLKENLASFKEEAFLSRRLVRLDTDLPLEIEIDSLRVGEPDQSALAEVFRELEFGELWERFASRSASGLASTRLCLTEADLADLAREIEQRRAISLDTETTSKDPFRAALVGLSISSRRGRAWYVPLSHQYPGAPAQLSWPRVKEILGGLLEDPGVSKVGQNIKYDAVVLRRHGVDLKGLQFDTMVASYVLNPGLRQHNLDYLSQHYLNHRMIAYHEVAGKGAKEKCFSRVEVEEAARYAGEDAEVTLRLKEALAEKLAADGNESLFYDLEMRLVPVLVDMEWAGIKVDVEEFRRMSRRFAEQLEEIEAEVFKEAGMEFNINSSQQLGFVLFEKLGLPAQGKTSKTKSNSTDVRVLKKLAAMSFRIPELLLAYRSVAKLKSTYVDALTKMVNPETGRIHTSFNQTVAATGRLSSSKPNLQNIPIRTPEGRAIRRGFVAETGNVLLSADYSQIELRVFAHYSQDTALIEAFKNGEDIHARTASELFEAPRSGVSPEQRRIAKAINFGIIYGMGPHKLSEELGIDHKTAKAYIDTYYKKHEGVLRFRERMIEEARAKGFVTTLFNRRRYLPDVMHKSSFVRAEAERMAVNTPIQGTAADLIKRAMICIHGRLADKGWGARMLLQVHDELVFEVPQQEVEEIKPIIKEEMESVYPLSVPLEVEMNTGRNWSDAH